MNGSLNFSEQYSSPRWSSIKCSGDKTSLMARRSCFILHFKRSFLISKSKFHHKIVLLFKYRDKSFYKLFEGKNISPEIALKVVHTTISLVSMKRLFWYQLYIKGNFFQQYLVLLLIFLSEPLTQEERRYFK